MTIIKVKPVDVLRAKRFCKEAQFWETYRGAGLTAASAAARAAAHQTESDIFRSVLLRLQA